MNGFLSFNEVVMSYVLSAMTDLDIAQVVKDSISNERVHRHMVLVGLPPFPKWAIDRERSSYLLTEYSITGTSYYIFFYRERIYEFRFEESSADSKKCIRFLGDEVNVVDIDGFEEALALAFDVYGEFGFGKSDGFSEVIPVFNKNEI